ncbi:TRAP-type C4-dicarboxylate transport system, small permease component [Pseudooceanicola antarcticus]|uniref:TRAP transporter small permease protein n=1 Tax=Pseudooceanicola antarcticus TaxID=1247613 RepID=A0A285JIF2_9RHOB|nr:TRAP transporter small permease [Pseudooceanicola antarcticus]PJE26444.1 TRAP transporter small permease [Pseudooceanicola antarcticus]SNY59577.1 TRAP-type C4-dicarboxylate transport system, small permease component [Pseudooceanicola antarcticus]
MKSLEKAADYLSQGLALIGSIGLFAMLAHVTLDVALRNFADTPIPATNEIVSRYYMVLIVFLPLAWVERQRTMITVEVMEMLLTPRGRRISDGAVALLATGIYGFLGWVTWSVALKSMAIGTFVDVLGHKIAVWPSYFLPPAGFVLAAAMTALRLAIIIAGPSATAEEGPET